MAGTPLYENIDYGSPDGSVWGRTTSDKVGLYGKAPVVRRTYAASLHNSTAYNSTNNAVIINEIQNTLAGLGIWGSA